MHPETPPTDRPSDPRPPADSVAGAGARAQSDAQSSLIDVNAARVTANDALLLPPTSFRAGPGRIVALRGENGSGKTTLLRALAGRVAPTTGTIRIGGRPVDERDPAFRRRVAVMIGLPPLASDLTVSDHIALVSSTWEETPATVEAATRRVLDEFGLTALASRYPHELSSGQTQLFGLASVFVRPFDVLLLDEPEQRLDLGRIELLAQAMLSRRADGATIVAATHSSGLADRTADLTVAPGTHA